MATPSMQQFCMGTSDWFKAIVSEAADAAGSMDNSNSSSPSATELICTRPPPPPPAFERRLRPPHDQALKCPRCDSTHTKFCYYNNYSLSQPRYFCKTCRRYWTKGGSLRNVPVGGGCRKNKRSAAKRSQPTDHHHHIATQVFPHGHQSTDLQLSNLNFMFEGSSHLFTSSCCDIGLGTGHLGLSMINGGQHGSIAEACQRLALPFEAQEEEEEAGAAAAAADTAKVGNSRMLSLEWPDQGCGEYSYGYGGAAIGVWAGMIGGGHGPSSAAM